MIKKIAFISIISLIVIIALTSTKFLNIINIQEQGGDASSYHDISAILYVLSGFLLCIIAFWTHKINIVAGIIPWGLGITLLGYGLYLCYVKGMMGAMA